MSLPSWTILILVANFLLLPQITVKSVVMDVDLTKEPTSALPVAENDTILNGINTIISLVEGITSAVDNAPESMAVDDRAMVRSRARNPSQQLPKESSEYEAYDCGFNCIIWTPGLNVNEFVKSESLGENSAVIDCFHSQELKDADTKLNTIPLSVKCVSHYTGRVIHVIISLKKSLRKKNHLQSAILASNFSQNLISVIRGNLPPNHLELNNLYLTLDLLLLEMEASSISPLGPWLHYLAIDGQGLQAIDALLLKNLTLDYFVLEGCQLLEERIFDRPNEFALNDLSVDKLSKLFDRCMVVWTYACPELGVFDMVADRKAQTRGCTRELPESKQQTTYDSSTPHFSSPAPLEAYDYLSSPLTTLSPKRHTTRHQRSIFVETETTLHKNTRQPNSNPNKEVNHEYLEHSERLPVVEKLLSEFKDDMKILTTDLRRDIAWYQKTLNLLIAIVITLVIALVATALAFYLTVRQMLFDKRHCPRALM